MKKYISMLKKELNRVNDKIDHLLLQGKSFNKEEKIRRSLVNKLSQYGF